MVELLGDMERVEVIIDCVLAHGKSKQEHDARLKNYSTLRWDLGYNRIKTNVTLQSQKLHILVTL